MSFIFKPRLDVEALVPKWLLETMHTKALEVLELMGIRVTNKQLLGRIKGHNGFSIENDWVQMKSNLIGDLLSEIRQRVEQGCAMNDEELMLSAGYPSCSYIIDPKTNI